MVNCFLKHVPLSVCLLIETSLILFTVKSNVENKCCKFIVNEKKKKIYQNFDLSFIALIFFLDFVKKNENLLKKKKKKEAISTF